MRRNDMESGSPRGLPLSPRCHKGVLGYPGRLWRPFYRKICSLRCRQMYLLCPVFALRQPGYVSTAGINSRQKVKGKGREEGRTSDPYDITIARKAPAFSSPSKNIEHASCSPRKFASSRCFSPAARARIVFEIRYPHRHEFDDEREGSHKSCWRKCREEKNGDEH